MNPELPAPQDAALDRPRRTEPRPDACRYSWCDLDTSAAAELWGELSDWVDWLRHRYQLGSRIPTCWYRHGSAVELLTALMAAHHAAYLPGPEQHDTPREDLVAWHMQWLWPVVDEITRISDFSGCGPGRCGYRTQLQTLLPGLDEFVSTDLEDRAPAQAPAPPETDAIDLVGLDLITDDEMSELVATQQAEAIEVAGHTAAVRYRGHVWVYSRLSGGWIPERGTRRRP